MKNISRYELDPNVDITERFVRGDAARTTAGSGLGLSIAKSFTEACGGEFSIQIDADLFTARVTFPSRLLYRITKAIRSLTQSVLDDRLLHTMDFL